jgi:hypothetical protein
VAGPGGGPLAAGSVSDDGDADVLVGQGQQDWFFCDRTIDVCGDRRTHEQAFELRPAV